jgi:putative tricarboxylic transport membrane protein
MGGYAVNGSPFDLILLLGLGIIGFGMRRFGIPVLPLIVGVNMGPLIELQGRRALQLAGGSPRGLLGGVDVQTGQFALSPLVVTVYLIILVVLIWPLVYPLIKRRLPGGRTEPPAENLTATGGDLK